MLLRNILIGWLTFSSSMALADKQALPFFDANELTPFWLKDKKNFTPARVTPFSVIDQNSKVVNEKTLAANLAVVNFFFAECPELCPLMMQSLKRFQTKLGADNKLIEIYSFSVQPKADTPEQLREFAKAQKLDLKNWHLLTGDQNVIFKIGKEVFKADGSVGAQKKADSFIHTQNVYLVDRNLHIRGIYNSEASEEMRNLVNDILLLANNTM